MLSVDSLQNGAFKRLKLTMLLPDLNERDASDHQRSTAVTPMQFVALGDTPAVSLSSEHDSGLLFTQNISSFAGPYLRQFDGYENFESTSVWATFSGESNGACGFFPRSREVSQMCTLSYRGPRLENDRKFPVKLSLLARCFRVGGSCVAKNFPDTL